MCTLGWTIGLNLSETLPILSTGLPKLAKHAAKNPFLFISTKRAKTSTPQISKTVHRLFIKMVVFVGDHILRGYVHFAQVAFTGTL
jgi:hypothetical protein